VIIDDDLSVLRSLRRLIGAAGYDVKTFDRPSELLRSELPTSNACLVVDIHLPEMSGIELCENLAVAGRLLPVVLITGQLDEVTAENIRRARAVAALLKPCRRDVLLDAIGKALKSKLPA
jgi:two-component system, LuxR family, response regulator FixJ